MRSRGYHITIIARQLSTTRTFDCPAIVLTLDLNQQEFVQIVAGLLLKTIERLGAMAAPRGLI